MSWSAWLIVLLSASAFVSLGAFIMTLVNLRVYAAPPLAPKVNKTDGNEPRVSIGVPARNEEANLEACVRSLLAQDLTEIEVLVYDDGSDDRTPEILAKLAAEDERVLAVRVEPLPDGWNGKQHACWRMSRHARAQWMLFTDADVRFEPGAVRAALAFAESSDAGLVSTFPRQLTGSLGEALIVPMIFFVLFSYLPMPRMRNSTDPSASAACGQFVFVRRDAYEAAGGHQAVRDSMHEGVKLPRLVRKAGFRTDLFDGTDLCRVRMYEGFGQTWRGFTKNAYEGLGSVGLLVFITVMHLLRLAPWVVVPLAAGWALLGDGQSAGGRWGLPIAAWVLAVGALLLQVAQTLKLAGRFRTPKIGVWLHPVGLVLMTLIQWHSLALEATGRRVWRGRSQGRSTSGA
ncbi:MAG: glycosyltransferase family 2 protein [Planctomycetota bacterium]